MDSSKNLKTGPWGGLVLKDGRIERESVENTEKE